MSNHLFLLLNFDWGGENMIKVSMSKDMQKLIDERAEMLNMTNIEYLKMLASLDISIQRYNEINQTLDTLINKIMHYQKVLGIGYLPLNEIPILQITNTTFDDESNDKK